MKVTRVTSSIVLSFLLLGLSLSGVSARIKSPFSKHVEDVKPMRSLSIDDLSDSVFEELRQFHDQGLASSLQIPNLALRVHRVVVEGSANDGDDFDDEARSRALVALKRGSDRFMMEASDQASMIQRHLEADGSSRELLSVANIGGIVLFTLFITFLIVLVVTNLIAAASDWPGIPAFNSPPEFLTGTPAISYQNINPCNRVPLQFKSLPDGTAAPMYSYLPVTGGFIRNIIASTGDSGAANAIMGFFESLFTANTVLSDSDNLPPNDANCIAKDAPCSLTAECCTNSSFVVDCKNGPNEEQYCDWAKPASDTASFEPFCYLWSTTDDGKSIDTLAFVPRTVWPPIKPVSLVSLLPLCAIPANPFGVAETPLGDKAIRCTFCEYTLGFPITDFNIGGVPFKMTIQWGGVALSWAENAKLAFGTNAALSGSGDASTPKIWDGFRSFPLPEVPDINFWTQFTINMVPLATFVQSESQCAIGGQPPTAFFKRSFYLRLDFEIYIGFDKQTYGADGAGNATQTGESLAGNLGAGIRGRNRNLYSDGQNLWRDLQNTASEDPCVIITMTAARIKIPLVGNLIFGNGIGGFCNFSPEETGVRCSPSGFFFNLEQKFSIEGGLAGILASVLSSQQDSIGLPETQSAGNSIGVFQSPDGDNEAVVFRLEFPVVSLFGVTFPGSGRPLIHFQLIKGSEVERRRQTLLRTKTSEERPWIHNCAQVAQECKPNSWAPYYRNQADADLDKKGMLETKTQICTDILLNENDDPDKLLYYNRIMIAEPLDESDKYKITPPAGSHFKVAEKYNFENNPDGNIVIVYLAMADFGVIIISIRKISITLIFSDRAPTMEGIDQNEFESAKALYKLLEDSEKSEFGGIWEPPTAFNFPSKDAYEAYLPMYNEDRTAILNLTETSAAAEAFNAISDINNADQMAVFVRIFCQITVLFFADIQLGFIMENFADSQRREASLWAVAGQFQVTLLGLQYSVAVDKTIDFDSRRRRHLIQESPEAFERALAADGLANNDWSVAFSVGCEPDSLCEAFVEFFEDVGEAIWDGMVAIGEFFTEDLIKFANDAIDAVGDFGKKLISGIVDFANKVGTAIINAFKNGEAAQIVSGPRLEAFGNEAMQIYNSFTDGKFTIDDVVAIGNTVLLAVEAVSIAFDLLVAGIKDIVAAIGSAFKNVAGAIGDFFGGGEPWDELRVAPAFTDTSVCYTSCRDIMDNSPSNTFEIKRKCWCMDELECPIKPPQKRRCSVKSWCVSSCTKCSGWSYVATEITSLPFTDPKRFPRFEGRVMDEGCRKERMADIAVASNINDRMDTTGKLVDGNFNSNFKGLGSFSPSKRTERGRRRRLESQVGSVSFPKTEFVIGGVIPDQPVEVTGIYSGAQLSSTSSTPNQLSEQQFQSTVDLSSYSASPPKFSDDENFNNDLGEGIATGHKRAAATPFLDGMTLNDPHYLDRQPTVLPPNLSKASTIIAPIRLDCASNKLLADAWRAKLQGSTPETLRTRRSRRHLQAERGAMTLLETTVEGVLMALVKQGGFVDITPGSIDGGEVDVFENAKRVLGTTGAGEFLDQSNLLRRRLQKKNIANYDLAITVIDADARGDRFFWRFAVTASDTSGTSNAIELDAEILYGAPEISNAPPSEIQTRCGSSPFSVEGLEDDRALKLIMDVPTFKPQLKTDNCPNPFHYIESVDATKQDGVACTTNYARIQRSWYLKSHETGEKVLSVPMYTQDITLGGLELDGAPGTPEFDLERVVYFLPNEPNAKIQTNVEDFYKNGIAPRTECGFCGTAGKPGIIYSHPQDFDCSEVGDNIISVTILNSVGIEVVRTATATVIDGYPPNMATKAHTAYLNEYGWLDQENVTTPMDVDDNTWDNCGIASILVTPTPIYQCGDEGPQSTTLTAIDVNGNEASKNETVIVDDSSRRGIGEDGVLDLRKNVKSKLVNDKMKDDFNFGHCREIAVYVRPEGESNFKELIYPVEDYPQFDDFEPTERWKIPKCKDDKHGEDLRFHQALCGNYTLTADTIGETPCAGEIKVEVKCRDRSMKGKGSDPPLVQTCYKAKLFADYQCRKRPSGKTGSSKSASDVFD